MKKSYLTAMAIGFTLITNTPAKADDPVITSRCGHDSLGPGPAEQRLEWMRRCALTRSMWVKREMTVDGKVLTEYRETSDFFGKLSFVGVDESFDINSTFILNLFKPFDGAISQVDGTGPLFGYKLWYKDISVKKARPTYPTFGTTSDIADVGNVAVFPHPSLANCDLYDDSSGTKIHVGPFYVNAWCTSSCYTSDQKILFPDGYLEISTALEKRKREMIVLDSRSRLDRVSLTNDYVDSYTRDVRDADYTIYVLNTQSGGSLRVTAEHPVLISTGYLLTAKEMKSGMELISVDGSSDSIKSIETIDYHGKVYNLKPRSRARISNILVAQGYLVGSSAFQNEYVEYVNRRILGRSIPAYLVP